MKDLRRLLSFIMPYRRRFALALALMLGGVIIDMALPWLFGQTIDRGLASGRLGLTALLAFLLVAGAGIRSLLAYFQWMAQQRVGQDAMKDLRDALFARLEALPPSFYGGMNSGEIMSRMTGDVDAVQEYLGWGFILQIIALTVLLFISSLLLWLDWRLTLAVLIPLIGLGFIVQRFSRQVGPTWEAERKQMGELSRVLQEFISGIRVVKAFAREPLEAEKFDAQNTAARARNLARAGLEARALPSVNLMIGLAFAILVWVGVGRVMNGEMTVGRFFSYQWYLWSLIWPIQISGWLINLRRQAMAAAPRLFAILDAPLGILDAPDAVELRRVRGQIEFRDVTFAFPDEPDRPVLQGLNLAVEPGEVVAILGGTGSGKSSLINLIPRFYDVTAGQVLIDGVDVRDVTIASLRRHIGIVPQESFLFSASIRDNIAYGRPDAPEDALTEAARLAQAHRFIVALEDGYDTKVGERGVRLSGGQKQRVALARALLVDPAILILDEATSAVDTRTEHAIQQSLEAVMAGRTSLIIAQRLSTIKHADRIVVLKDGQVAETGTHQALLARDGEYARIFNLQFRQSEEGLGVRDRELVAGD